MNELPDPPIFIKVSRPLSCPLSDSVHLKCLVNKIVCPIHNEKGKIDFPQDCPLRKTGVMVLGDIQ